MKASPLPACGNLRAACDGDSHSEVDLAFELRVPESVYRYNMSVSWELGEYADTYAYSEATGGDFKPTSPTPTQHVADVVPVAGAPDAATRVTLEELMDSLEPLNTGIPGDIVVDGDGADTDTDTDSVGSSHLAADPVPAELSNFPTGDRFAAFVAAVPSDTPLLLTKAVDDVAAAVNTRASPGSRKTHRDGTVVGAASMPAAHDTRVSPGRVPKSPPHLPAPLVGTAVPAMAMAMTTMAVPAEVPPPGGSAKRVRVAYAEGGSPGSGQRGDAPWAAGGVDDEPLVVLPVPVPTLHHSSDSDQDSDRAGGNDGDEEAITDESDSADGFNGISYRAGRRKWQAQATVRVYVY